MSQEAARARTAVHFWSGRQRTADELAGWDPDVEPELHASGVGHGLFELYVRLRRRGALVASIGSRVPRRAAVVVAHANSLTGSSLDIVRLLLASRSLPIVLIRSDVPLKWRLPVDPDVEVMPNRSSCVERFQVWLPLLPQRGLEARDPARRGAVRSVAVKGNPENIPELFRSDAWSRQLERLDLVWLPDIPSSSSGSDNRWHDFTDVDVVLCVRDGDQGILRKPATRLVNAWMAGCIPIVGREPAYLELVNDGRDALVVDAADDCLESLERLKSSDELVRTLEVGGAARAAEFDVDRVLAQWQEMLVEAGARTVGLTTRIERVAAAVRVLVSAAYRRSARSMRRRRSAAG